MNKSLPPKGFAIVKSPSKVPIHRSHSKEVPPERHNRYRIKYCLEHHHMKYYERNFKYRLKNHFKHLVPVFPSLHVNRQSSGKHAYYQQHQNRARWISRTASW